MWLRRRKWCCPGFEARFSKAGVRGVSIFVDDAEGRPRFILQHRFLGRSPTLSQTRSRVTITTDTVIRFCPHCGANLDRWYRGSLRRLARPDLAVRVDGTTV